MRFLCLGDSLMQENGFETYPQEGWPQALKLFLLFPNQSQVLNFAKNGRSTKTFIEEGLFEQALNAVLPGDIVFISFGHNDEKKEDPSRYTDPFGVYKENLALMAESLLSKGARPVFVTSMSRLHVDDLGQLIRSHGDYPKAMKEVAKKENVPCVDLEDISYQDLSKRSFEDNKGYFMWLEQGKYPNYPEGLKDLSHLSENGAKYVMRLLLPELRKMSLFQGLFV